MCAALKVRLGTIDPLAKLCVYDYAKDAESDCIIKEYVDKLLQLQFFPTCPADSDLENPDTSLYAVTSKISPQCSSDVISLLMSFFQECYFVNNMKDAINHKVAVVKVGGTVRMPCFSLTPDHGLKRLTEVKRVCALQFQTVAFDNARFIKELLCIRAAFNIKSDLQSSATNMIDLRTEIQKHFDIFFVKAKTEFLTNFKLKSIDWSNKRDNIVHVTPAWRRNHQQPPAVPHNHHAKKICTELEKSTLSVTASSAFGDYKKWAENFDKNFESSPSSNSSNNYEQNVPHQPLQQQQRSQFYNNNPHSSRGRGQHSSNNYEQAVPHQPFQQQRPRFYNNNPHSSRGRDQHFFRERGGGRGRGGGGNRGNRGSSNQRGRLPRPSRSQQHHHVNINHADQNFIAATAHPDRKQPPGSSNCQNITTALQSIQ